MHFWRYFGEISKLFKDFRGRAGLLSAAMWDGAYGIHFVETADGGLICLNSLLSKKPQLKGANDNANDIEPQ